MRGENAEYCDPQHFDTLAGIERRCRIHTRTARPFPGNRRANPRRSSGKLQGPRVAKRRHTRVQSADIRDRARWHHSLRHFAAPGVSGVAQAGDDVEDTNLSGARRAERKLNQLWPHVYRAAKYASRNVVSRLRRWLSVASF